jgi:hypothetical protein
MRDPCPTALSHRQDRSSPMQNNDIFWTHLIRTYLNYELKFLSRITVALNSTISFYIVSEIMTDLTVGNMSLHHFSLSR